MKRHANKIQLVFSKRVEGMEPEFRCVPFNFILPRFVVGWKFSGSEDWICI